MVELGLIIVEDVCDNLSLAVIQMELTVCTHTDMYRHTHTVKTEREGTIVKKSKGVED